MLALIFARASKPAPRLVFLMVPAKESLPEGVPERYPNGTRLVSVPWELGRLDARPHDLVTGFEFAGAPKVSYDGTRLLFAGRRDESEPFHLWEARSNGSRLRAIPSGDGDAAHPCYLPDGNIVFSGVAVENPTLRALFILNRKTGERERITFGDAVDRPYAILRDGRILFWHEPVNDNETQSRYRRKRWMTVNQDGTEIQGFYPEYERGLPPVQSPDGAWVVDAQPDGAATRGIYAVDPTTGRTGERLFDAPDFHVVAPSFASRVQRPPILTSIVDPKKTTGTLYCLDARLTTDAPTPSVKEVRVTNGAGRPIRVVPVEPDGSFFIEIPANAAVGFQLIGSDGRTLASSPRTIWVRPGEARGCVGCHTDPELAPENRAPLALTKPPVPVGIPETKAP
jgi:hypothetical protein